jgi:DNA-binding winged helix-turn-helix (wHTH) protein
MQGGSARLVAKFDGWTLRRMPLELLRGDQPVRLQEQPLQVLEALLLKAGELVTREDLTARLWPDTVVDFEAGLNTAVRKLRVALADDADAPRYVETVPRQGYRFIGQIERPVERRDDDRVMEGPRAPTRVPQLDAVVRASAGGRRSPWTRTRLALVGLVVAAAAATAFVAIRPPASRVEQLAVQSPLPKNAQLSPPRSLEAYDEWLKGTLAWQQVGAGGATDQEIERVEAMFTRAIEVDDTYAAAYADRARVRIAKHASRADGSEANVANARADIALAQKYAGGTPHVLIRAAQLAFLVDNDLRRALGLIEAAEQVGSLDADLLLTKGNFLMFDGRLEESLVTHAQAARLDPGNATIFRFWVSNLAAAHRPVEALRVLKDFDSKYPGRLYRGEYIFAFTGSTAAWWDEVGRLRTDSDPNATLSSEFDLLRYEQRFAELRARLDAASSTFTQHSAYEARVGASPKPVAELRGWERLLAGDAHGAAREGAELAAFVERLPLSAASEWWRRLLGAESALMLGEQSRAVDDARVAVQLVGNSSTFAESLHVRVMAARVLAWAGEEDEAIDTDAR